MLQKEILDRIKAIQKYEAESRAMIMDALANISGKPQIGWESKGDTKTKEQTWGTPDETRDATDYLP